MNSHVASRLISVITAITLSLFQPGAPARTKSIGVLTRSSAGLQTPARNIIQYTSFSGVTYQLEAFDGRYVRYALPDSWTGTGGLSPEEIRLLVDATDLVYAHMAELVDDEPEGSGLLTIAIVDTGASAGLAGINRKGVEISPRMLDNVRFNLSAGLVSDQIVHELSHNFEVQNAYIRLSYPDSSHSWTDFLIPYIEYYSRAGTTQTDADALLDQTILDYTKTWDAVATSGSWATCVRDAACPNIRANNAWAGFVLRFARLHGPAALRRAFTYLKNYRAAHPDPPATAEEKNDLLVEALAAGAEMNISCEVDAWKWSITPAARARLAERYPSADALCMDGDGDTFTPLQGDFDDTNASVRPGTAEVINSIDDDCDRVVDDVLIRETTDFPATGQGAPLVNLPARITGRAEIDDQDSVVFETSEARMVRVKLKSLGTFSGWATVAHTDGQGTTQQFYTNGSAAKTLLLERGGKWALTVKPEPNVSGDYEVTIEDAGPATPLVSLSVTPNATTGAWHIEANIDTSRHLNDQPTQVRFWASGVGMFTTAPLAQRVAFDWTPPAGDGAVGLRTQLLSSAFPVTSMSAPLWVNRTTGVTDDTRADLVIRSLNQYPAVMDGLQNFDYKFEISNTGAARAEAVVATVRPGVPLAVISAQTSRGNIQVNPDKSVTLSAGDLAPNESVSFTITVSPNRAEGQITTTATASSRTVDRDPSNNSLSLTLLFALPTSGNSVYAIPLRPEGSAGARRLTPGAMARALVQITGLNLQDTYARPDAANNWPFTLGGIEVTVGARPAQVVAVTRELQSSTAEIYRIDFAVPEDAPLGTGVEVRVRRPATGESWPIQTEVVDSAPALWATDGSSRGAALVQNADFFTVISPEFPALADNRQRMVLYATGIRRLAARGALTVRARTPDGREFILPVEYAGSQIMLPGLDQIIVRLPIEISGAGSIEVKIDGAEDSQVSLPVR